MRYHKFIPSGAGSLRRESQVFDFAVLSHLQQLEEAVLRCEVQPQAVQCGRPNH